MSEPDHCFFSKGTTAFAIRAYPRTLTFSICDHASADTFSTAPNVKIAALRKRDQQCL